MSGGQEPEVSFAMEQSDFLELATNSASLINVQSLNSIFVKAGYDRPDFVIQPTREKVIILIHLCFCIHCISIKLNFLSSSLSVFSLFITISIIILNM